MDATTGIAVGLVVAFFATHVPGRGRRNKRGHPGLRDRTGLRIVHKATDLPVHWPEEFDWTAHSPRPWTGLALAGGSPTSSMVCPPQAVLVTLARSMRDTVNHRMALRNRHHPTRYHWPFVEANSTGSTSRVVVVPSFAV